MRPAFYLTSCLLLLAALTNAEAEDELTKSISTPIPSVPLSTGYSVLEFARVLQLAPEFERVKAVPDPEFISHQVKTELGNVFLRYPRNAVVLKVLSPVTSIRRSWEAGALAVLELGLPPLPKEDYPEWNVILTDQTRLEVNGSRVSSAFCHTALMGPPADIVIDGYRLLHPCDGTPVSNPERALQRSLVHEIGHGVEYQLLGNGFSRRQRWHAEGFATWFETWATGKLRGEDSGKVQRLMREKAAKSFHKNWRPYLFLGSPEDYLTSYALIASVAERRPVADLVAVYRRSSEENLTLEQAVERQLGLNFEQWMAEAQAFLTEEQGSSAPVEALPNAPVSQ